MEEYMSRFQPYGEIGHFDEVRIIEETDDEDRKEILDIQKET
jgi:hypothetical protein